MSLTTWLAERSRWRAVVVFTAVYLQSFLLYGCAVVSSSFYVSYLTARGVSKFQVGLIGMFPSIGYIFHTFYDVLEHLTRRKISLKVAQSMFLTVIILNCVGQGFAELIPTDYNQLLVLVLILQRGLHGYVAFLVSKATVECCRVWFPDHVNMTVGLECSAYYLGGALAILMGGYVYQIFNFKEPFLLFGFVSVLFLLFNLAVLPKNSDPVLTKPKEAVDSTEASLTAALCNGEGIAESECESKGLKDDEPQPPGPSQGVSWRVVFPLAAQCFTVVLEGFSASITTPYLHDMFYLPISQGSSYLFVFYMASMIGCTTSGVLLQRKCASRSKVVATGSLLCAVGVLLIFPGQGVPFLFNIVPQMAYLGMFLQGHGCQMVAVATLSAIEETHVALGRRPCTRENRSTVSTLWLFSWMLSVYGGHMVALLVMKFMTYTHGGWMLAACSLVAVAISIAQDVAIRRCQTAWKRPKV